MSIALGGMMGAGLINMSAGIANSRIKKENLEERFKEIREQQQKDLNFVSNLMKQNTKNSEPCCCGKESRCNAVRNIFIFKSSKKEAYETALHWPGARAAILHYHNSYPGDNNPHYHPTFDFEGKVKIPGIHIRFPK